MDANKTKRSNFNKGRFIGTFSPAEDGIFQYVTEHRAATLKELAAELFDGDYLKAKNSVRRLRWAGLIKFGSERGSYVKGE